jgi:hypothetical protein
MGATGRKASAAWPAFGWHKDFNQYTLETAAEIITELRSRWAAGDELIIPTRAAVAVARHRRYALVTDIGSGTPVAEIRLDRGCARVELSSGLLVRWVLPTWLVWQCGFVAVDGPGIAPGTNVVLFAPDGTGIVTVPEPPPARRAELAPMLTEPELLLALGWTFLLVGQGGRRTTSVVEALYSRASTPLPAQARSGPLTDPGPYRQERALVADGAAPYAGRR